MIFEPKLESAILIKRYKRFLADVIHPIHGEMTVHCPNTGSMINCWLPGWRIWLQKSSNLKRKYPYTWVLAENDESEFIGINTHFANQIVYEALLKRQIESFKLIDKVEKEVKYGDENSRIDFLLTHENSSKTYLEVKSVTLKCAPQESELNNPDSKDSGLGAFPDAVTTRGQKHLRELIQCVKSGHRAALLFLVQHSGIQSVSIARDIDPDYAKLLRLALEKGVEVVAFSTKITPHSIILERQIPFSA